MISPEEALGSRDLTSTTMADLPIDDLNVSSNETLITPAQLKR
jgi:3-deoxy-7-phosphoheptulonate synthase